MDDLLEDWNYTYDVDLNSHEFRQVILLHELGHAMGKLPSDKDGGSMENTRKVLSACF